MWCRGTSRFAFTSSSLSASTHRISAQFVFLFSSRAVVFGSSPSNLLNVACRFRMRTSARSDNSPPKMRSSSKTVRDHVNIQCKCQIINQYICRESSYCRLVYRPHAIESRLFWSYRRCTQLYVKAGPGEMQITARIDYSYDIFLQNPYIFMSSCRCLTGVHRLWLELLLCWTFLIPLDTLLQYARIHYMSNILNLLPYSGSPFSNASCRHS